MTATNHMLAGAVVAVSVQQPLLVLPLAFLSHFILDMFPHFGVDEYDSVVRNHNPLFRYILLIDILMVASLLVMLPLALRGTISWWILTLGMLGAWIPDSVWAYRFLFKERQALTMPRQHWLTRLHQNIQWFERPLGIVTELAWFGAMGAILGALQR